MFYFLASACGGGGTCSQCKCQVVEGGGSILAAEESHFNATEQKQGWRLSCQVPVKNDLKISVPDDWKNTKDFISKATVILLEENERIITLGQEYVFQGQTVNISLISYIY